MTMTNNSFLFKSLYSKILILGLLSSSMCFANPPIIEKRSLSKIHTADEKQVENTQTTTEWQLYQKILELDEEITQLRDSVERMQSTIDFAKKNQSTFQDSIASRLDNQEDALIEVVDKLELMSPTPVKKKTYKKEDDFLKNKPLKNNSLKQSVPVKKSALKTLPQPVNKKKQPLTEKKNSTQEDNKDQTQKKAEDIAKKAYLNAYKEFKENGQKAGVTSMKTFIKDYPDSKLLPSSHFWVGEFYLSGSKPDFSQAKLSFLTVVDKFPKSSKVPKSLYRLGYIAKNGGNHKLAKKFMRQILQKHENSREAGLAKAFLERYSN